MISQMAEDKIPDVWSRVILWVTHRQRIIRLVSLSAILVIFLVFLPGYLRIAFWDGLHSHPILASMLVVFSLVVISLVWSSGQHLDAWIFLIFNVRWPRPIWLDRMMLGFTQIGSGFTALGLALILYLFSERLLFYELILGTLTLWLVVELLKFLIHRSRPFIRLDQARIIGFPARGRSFPSGHTSQVFFMATLMSQHFQTGVWVAILLYAVAFFVAITRIYVGAHYPRDVLAGAILGSAWGLLGVIVDGYVLNRIL